MSKKLTEVQWEKLNTAYGEYLANVDDYDHAGGSHYVLGLALRDCGISIPDRGEIAGLVSDLLTSQPKPPKRSKSKSKKRAKKNSEQLSLFGRQE